MEKYIEFLNSNENNDNRLKYIQNKLDEFLNQKYLNYYLLSNYSPTRIVQMKLFAVYSLELMSEYFVNLEEKVTYEKFIKEIINVPFYHNHSVFLNKVNLQMEKINDKLTLEFYRSRFLKLYSSRNMYFLFYFVYLTNLNSKTKKKFTLSKLLEEQMNEFLTSELSFDDDEYNYQDLNFERDICENFSEKETKNQISEIKSFLKKNTPKTIYEYLNKHIVGQDEAKRDVSTFIYMYLTKIAYPELNLQKHNFIMIGPSGCGKTEIMRCLKNFLPIKLIIYDVSSLTSAGYKGDNKENILKQFLELEEDIGIVFLDEFDKICMTESEKNFNYSVQGQLLSMIEGSEILIESEFEDVIIDTSNLLFIAGGAFEDLQNKKCKQTVGFNSSICSLSQNNNEKTITIEDLLKYGLRTELAGRFQGLVQLHKLTKQELEILTRKILKEYEDLLGIHIKLSDKLLKEKFIENKLGCRYIRYELNKWMKNIIFEELSNKKDYQTLYLDINENQVFYKKIKKTKIKETT